MLIRLYWEAVERINIYRKQVSRTGETWSGFGRLVEYKRESTHSHFSWVVQIRVYSGIKPDPEVETRTHPDKERAISMRTRMVVKIS